MKWGATLRGAKLDLEHWVDLLKPNPNSDAFVEHVEQDGQTLFILTSRSFEGCDNEDEVAEAAKPLIGRINALAYMERNCQPVDLLAVAERDPSGRVIRQLVYAAFHAKGRSSAFSAGVAVRNGVEVKHPRKPSFVQSALAITVEDLVKALDRFAQAHDWLELYKTFEVIKKVCGGKGKIATMCGFDPAIVNNCSSNINLNRHHETKHDLPSEIWSFSETKTVVGRLLRALLVRQLSQQ